MSNDIAQLKTMLQAIEQNTIKELVGVERTCVELSPLSEYCMIKHLVQPILETPHTDIDSSNIDNMTLCSIDEALDRELSVKNNEIGQLQAHLEKHLFLPQIDQLKSLGLKVVLK